MAQVAVDESTGRVINEGETIFSFRGEMYRFSRITRESGGNSNGKILTDGGEYYPSVFGLKLLTLTDPHGN